MGMLARHSSLTRADSATYAQLMVEPSFSRQRPDGEDRPRRVCDNCGWIDYVNPRIVVGAVCAWENRLLLCRRAIEPRVGLWTIPSGFLEERETTEEGAARETREEACAEIAIDALLGIFNVPHISHVHLIYRARLVSPAVAPGPESREVELFRWEDIPWFELAFPSVTWSLERFRDVRGLASFAPARGGTQRPEPMV